MKEEDDYRSKRERDGEKEEREREKGRERERKERKANKESKNGKNEEKRERETERKRTSQQVITSEWSVGKTNAGNSRIPCDRLQGSSATTRQPRFQRLDILHFWLIRIC